MKKMLLIAVMTAALIVSAGAVLAQQSGYGQGYGPQQPQGQGWFCPWSWCGQQYGQQGMGPGMMRGYRGQGMHGWQGRQMGPGMMHGWQDQGRGPGMMPGYRGQGRMHGGQGPGWRGEQWGRGQYGPYGGEQEMAPLTKSKARNLAEDYVAGNPNLKIGAVNEKDGVFEARIETKDGSLVEKLLIDKETGWMKKAY